MTYLDIKRGRDVNKSRKHKMFNFNEGLEQIFLEKKEINVKMKWLWIYYFETNTYL